MVHREERGLSTQKFRGSNSCSSTHKLYNPKQITLSLWILIFPNVLVWSPQNRDPTTRILVQLIHLGADPRKHGIAWVSQLQHYWHLGLVVRESLEHCRIFSSIPSLYPTDASSKAPASSYDNQKCLQTLPNVSWETKSPLVKKHWYSGYCGIWPDPL